MSQEIQINTAVILGISEQNTRQKVQKIKNSDRLLGGLMGKNLGGKIVINSSFELVSQIDNQGNILSIDHEHLIKKVKLIKTDDKFNHFRNDEFLGWYSTCDISKQYTQNDIEIHKQISNVMNSLQAGDEGDQIDKLNEDTLFLTIDINTKILSDPQTKSIPMHLYKAFEKEGQLQFNTVQYSINAEQGEIISIESAKTQDSQTKSKIAEKMQTTLNATIRYNEKIEQLIQLLDNPQLNKNPILLRELNQLLNSCPSQIQGQFDQSLLNQYCDANLVSFLSSISATNKVIQDVYQSNPSFKNASFIQRQQMDFDDFDHR